MLECERCNHRQPDARNRVEYGVYILCDDCADDEAQQQAKDRNAEPPPTMDELHRAAWLAKERAR